MGMTRDDWRRYEETKHDEDVLLAMAARCEEQSHDWENCATALLQVYQACKWCGQTKR